MSRIIEKILNNVMLDSRIEDGMFDAHKESHMDALREYLIRKGIEEGEAKNFCNKVVEGKYPERQAFNSKGILVTFPTPEYKAKAIEKGSHFEKDPTKAAPNIFGGAQPQQGGAPAPNAPAEEKPAEPKTSLPISQAAATPPAEEPDPTGQPTQTATTTPPPETTAAPQQTQTEPAPEPTELPPPTPKSPAEKQADKDVIKKMLKGDDYMLEEVCEWLANNAPDHIREHIRGI